MRFQRLVRNSPEAQMTQKSLSIDRRQAHLVNRHYFFGPNAFR
jgi:hypothetical protein